MRTSLVIKDHVIRYVHAKKPFLTAIQSYGERFLPSGIVQDGQVVDRDTFKIIIDECIEAWGLKGQSVQFCAPDAFVVIKNIQLSYDIPENEIRGHLFLELGESIHLPFEDPVFDYQIIGDKNGKRDVILIASREKSVLQMRNMLSEYKLKPNAADLSSLSIYRLLHKMEKVHADEHVLLVQFDVTSANATIFTNDLPVFTRHFKPTVSLNSWVVDYEGGTERLVWKGNEAEIDGQTREIYTEIDRVLKFYHFSVNDGKASVTRMILVGDHPYLNKMVKMCRENLDVQVDSGMDESIETKKGSLPQHFFEAAGLALKKEVQ